NDGVELRLVQLSRRPPDGKALDAQRDDIAAAADIVLAGNEGTRLVEFPPPRGKGPDGWLRFAEPARGAPRELRRAARSGDASAVKAAASKVLDGCTNCHDIFRQ